MWATLDLLVRREARGRDISENVEEWLETVNRKIAASADGDKNRKKTKGELREDDGINKGSTTSPRPSNNNKEHCEKFRKRKEEENKKGVRSWNPRKTKRGHDREISNRLEQLMGSSVVNITDRNYMLELQQRIIETHYEKTEKRMANRMNEEIEREKRLMLENKMPVDDSHPEISNHPIFTVQKRFERRGNRRKQSKLADDSEIRDEKRIHSVNNSEKRSSRGKSVWDPKRDKQETSEGEESESNGYTPETFNSDSSRVLVDHAGFRKAPEEMKSRNKKSYEGPEEEQRSDEGEYVNEIEWGTDLEVNDSGRALQMPEDERYVRDDEEENEFIIPEKKFETLKYESPLIKELRRAKTVEELYTLADQIVGPVPDFHAK